MTRRRQRVSHDPAPKTRLFTLERVRLLALLAVWSISLAFTAVDATGGPSWRGYEMLARGWSGVASGVASWYANPLFVVTVILAWNGFKRTALAGAVLGLLLALSSFVAGETARRAGLAVPEFSFAAGFYIWLAAYFGVVASCLSALTKHETATNS